MLLLLFLLELFPLETLTCCVPFCWPACLRLRTNYLSSPISLQPCLPPLDSFARGNFKVHTTFLGQSVTKLGLIPIDMLMTLSIKPHPSLFAPFAPFPRPACQLKTAPQSRWPNNS